MKDPSKLLDDAIVDMEVERRRAHAALAAVSRGPSRDRLREAIAMLDAKIAEARSKREELGARYERATRVKTLVAEIKRLDAEALAMPGGPECDEQARKLQARFRQLQTELQELVARNRGE